MNEPKDCGVYLHCIAYQVQGYIKDSSVPDMGHDKRETLWRFILCPIQQNPLCIYGLPDC